ncbi:uncharacterized protein FOMMEDRAFT_162213 [Fomitiporia mediterranea MF3/22]|uniref:uncharacterized protein n=1 Tax=Fomitiporia mediterranea (strain MF3/22) TaxID=694068 RepID=UPI0004408344|nr:uncharacterized protein FOMMEDRAFT_162213 [Fomitiporia mediterranea MF3/22]EJC97874.1 hypothetical protein FOMMEDRAFT_162213 [Fomitiporia mediterranea MF3/22]
MAQPLVLVLLKKLLDICKRCANRALPLLLRLFSVNCAKKNDVEFTGIGDFEITEHDSGGDNQGITFSTPDDRSVIVACSSIPSKATASPSVHAHHATSIDSVTSFPRSTTSTLLDPPRFMSECDVEAYFSPSLGAIKENSYMEGSITDVPLCAEPAGLSASPGRSRSKPLKTILPSDRPRYNRNITIESNQGPWAFEPLATFDVYRNQDVGSWERYIHPEGPPYYLLKQSGENNFSFLTEANLQKTSVLREIKDFVHKIETHAKEFSDRHKDILNNVEVVLEVGEDDWSYYMIHLERRCLFWLHTHDVSHILGDDFGVESLDHFHYQLDFEFWQHIEYFPNHRELYPDIFNEVMGILNYWRIDVKSSADSAAPYDASDLDTLVKSVKHLHTVYDSGNCAYAVASVARIMGLTSNERQLNFYGFDGARMSVLQSVRGNNPKKRSTLIKCLSPLLFYAPETHLSGLERLWVDGQILMTDFDVAGPVHLSRFDTLDYLSQDKLERDWESFVLTSTVLLNANVALLSTPIILSDNGDAGLWASPAAIASQVSIVASIASIVIGLLLVRQIRISGKDIEITASDTVGYLSRRKHKQLGLETIAIQYSLPYALLIVITFLTSIAIACFFRINGTPGITAQMIYAVSWLFAIPLIFWTVLTGWETNNQAHWSQLFSASWWGYAISEHWPRHIRRKPRDTEASQEAGVVETAIESSVEQLVTSVGPNTSRSRDWGVRVKIFGPIRRPTRF